jgi:hypothetical protein
VANLAAASYSTQQYISSDGENELSTSALDIGAQKATEYILNDPNPESGSEQQTDQDIAAFVGSTVDIVDGVFFRKSNNKNWR